MALIRWEPDVYRLVNSLFDSPTRAGGPPLRRWVPAFDLSEAEAEYVLRADLPGLGEDDVAITFADNVLTVSGERRTEQEDTQAGYRRVERASGRFARSLRLPAGVDAEAITARFDRGVLEVHVPKPAQRTPHTIAISGSDPVAVESGPPQADAAE